MFSFRSRPQVVGRFVESLVPLPLGPRHWGQFSSAAREEVKQQAARVTANSGRKAVTEDPFAFEERSRHGRIIMYKPRKFQLVPVDWGRLVTKILGAPPRRTGSSSSASPVLKAD